jgi:hypothetical protein
MYMPDCEHRKGRGDRYAGVCKLEGGLLEYQRPICKIFWKHLKMWEGLDLVNKVMAEGFCRTSQATGGTPNFVVGCSKSEWRDFLRSLLVVQTHVGERGRKEKKWRGRGERKEQPDK